MYVAAKSCFARSAPDLLRHLGKLSSTLRLDSHTVLFSISPASTCSNATLTDLVTRLTSLPSSLGCLSAPVGLRVHAKTGAAAEQCLDEYTLCSVAIFNREDATPFRSTIQGREAPQVGRWHAFRKGEGAKLDDHQLPATGVDWESVWAQRESPQALPEQLKGLRPNDVETIVYLSDKASEGLCHSLEYFDRAIKLGMVAHPTPFLTGRPYTMFYNGRILSSGAVGICIRPSTNYSASVSVQFPDLSPVTPVLTVTDAEGNLIHSIDDANPSRLLLAAIQKLETAAKDDTFYVGVQSASPAALGPPSDQLFSILSGDPSRGTIALEGETAPSPGTRVRIYRRVSGQQTSLSPRSGVNFATAFPDGLNILSEAGDSTDGVIELDNTFLAVSENGLLVSRLNADAKQCERTWRSLLPGGSLSIRWL